MEQQGKGGQVLFAAALCDRLAGSIAQTITTSTFGRVSMGRDFRRVALRADRFREAHVIHSFQIKDMG